MISKKPIRLGLIGAGIFAKEVHIPTLAALRDRYELVAVCSRSRESAETAARLWPGAVDVFTDVDALLAEEDIEAVDILVPIDTMPRVIEKALNAGKHVISEKPVAPDVVTGRMLLAAQKEQVWMVAENFRYEDALLQAAQVVQSGEIGKPLMFHWDLYIEMTPEANQYYHTAWRRTGTFPGGFLLDGGVHVAAGFRLILGEVAKVTAMTRQMRPDLPPADTLSSVLLFDSGVIGAWNITYAGGAPWPHVLHIAGDKGSVSVHLQGLEVTTKGGGHRNISVAGKAFESEFADFAAAIREAKPHRNTPEQAVQDLAILEALFKSAETDCSVAPERIVR
jgi:predicted dehydrogenase